MYRRASLRLRDRVSEALKTPLKKMNGIIAFALRQRVIMLALFVATLVGGYFAFIQLNIEAYPDPTPPMVDVITQSSGLSAEEIERYITIPIETQTAGLPNLRSIRTISLYGLSDVKLQFSFDFTYEQALQQVLNRLSQLPPLLNGAQPQISPVSPIGEIYRYRLVGPPSYSVTDLKTLQDWLLQRRFRAVPGVIDVTGWGGKTKEFEVEVDLNKLLASKLTLPQVIQTLTSSNINVGGNTINIGTQSAVVRGVGLIRSIEELGNTMLAPNNGFPVLVSDVAAVRVASKPRLGIAGMNNDDDIVQGTVLMRRGEQSSPTIERVEREVETINRSNILPPGVRIERIYDRKELIQITTRTVLHNMALGIALIFVLQWLFLGNLRTALIVSATVPFALSFAIGIMILRSESANLLSVGAIDFGLIVDATVLMVESMFRRLAVRDELSFQATMAYQAYGSDFRGKMLALFHGAVEVNRAILFSAVIIIAGFIPLFTLSGVEGHIFGPMAKTYAYAIAGGLLATFTVTPALAALLLPDHVNHAETRLVAAIRRFYEPLLEVAVRRKAWTLAAAVTLLVASSMAVPVLGLEFLPKLEEGNLWIRATLPSTISLEEGNKYVNQMRAIIRSFPEVESVVSQHGRPDDGTDATGFFNAEFFAPLKPTSDWPEGMNKDRLTRDILARLLSEFIGVEFNFSQYLQDNVSEAVSGVKGENSIKLFGNDLEALSKTADRIKEVLSTVPGITDLSVFASLGQPTVQIDIDRARAGRYGLTPGDINSTVRAAIGGDSAGELYIPNSDQHFPIIVRLAPRYRESRDAISNIPVGIQSANATMQIPLGEVASVDLVSGAAYIYREQQQRYLPIKFSIRGRDLGGAIAEAQKKIAQQVALPLGSRLEWVGEFGNLQDAISRLRIIVPITLGLIAFLLWTNFGSLRDTLLAMSVIPMAVTGGIIGLFVTGTPFSVPAAIGFIALFGISVMNGIIMLSQYDLLVRGGMERVPAILKTGALQLRPVLMTCVIAGVGLLPAALSTGIGSQVQKPLALVVVSGMTLAPVLILLVLPALMAFFPRRMRVERLQPRAQPAQ
jgi:heavy metal efflux system protein